MRKTIGGKNYIWIDITQPSEDDIKYLKESFSIHPLTASAIIPALHYPDLDQFKNYISIILHYPHYTDKAKSKHWSSISLPAKTI